MCELVSHVVISDCERAGRHDGGEAILGDDGGLEALGRHG